MENETLDKVESSVSRTVEEMNLPQRFSQLDRRIRETITARPLVYVAGAFATGFLLARLARKARS